MTPRNAATSSTVFFPGVSFGLSFPSGSGFGSATAYWALSEEAAYPQAEEKMSDGLADDLAPPDHDCMRALERHLVFVEQGEDPERCRGHQRRLSEVELPGVERMEAVHVFQRRDGADDEGLVDLRRKR